MQSLDGLSEMGRKKIGTQTKTILPDDLRDFLDDECRDQSKKLSELIREVLTDFKTKKQKFVIYCSNSDCRHRIFKDCIAVCGSLPRTVNEKGHCLR